MYPKLKYSEKAVVTMAILAACHLGVISKMKKWILGMLSLLGMTTAATSHGAEESSLWKAYSTISEKEKKNGFDDLDEAERAFLRVWELEAEINNGGFDQYFFNSSGDHCLETKESLIRIGAQKTAEILADAMFLFPDGEPSKDQTKRQNQLKEVSPDSDRFESHDQRFLAYEEDVSGLALKHYEESR